MSRSIAGVTNWMTMFRWIVKLIRDEYGVEETQLTRHALLETGIGLSVEQVEEVLRAVDRSFGIRFPAATLDEVLRLEDLCMLAAWMRGFYRQPDFVTPSFAAACRAANQGLA